MQRRVGKSQHRVRHPFCCSMPLTDAVPDINSSDDDPLENHIDTVLDYVRSYHKMTKDGKLRERTASFHNMMKYMVACGWRKMRGRISQWHSEGFLHHLTTSSGIETSCNSYMSSLVD